jgi:hypothetical protein
MSLKRQTVFDTVDKVSLYALNSSYHNICDKLFCFTVKMYSVHFYSSAAKLLYFRYSFEQSHWLFFACM